MSKTYTTLSREAINYLCSVIKQVVSLPTDVINNINLADNLTFSNIHIKNLIDQCLIDAKDYSESVCSALIKLTCEKTTVQPTLDNSQVNVIYLYSADGNAPFQQYLKINDAELIDMGSTTISLTDYLTATEIASTYAKQVDLKTLTDEVSGIKTAIGTETLTTTATTIKGAINELANKAGVVDLTQAQYQELYANGSVVIDGETITYDPEAYYIINDDSSMLNITNTIDSTSTNTQVPSAKAVFDECKQGRRIDQSVIDTYGTEILKYPIGKWYIGSSNTADNFTDLPKSMPGIMEILSITPTKNPFVDSYAYIVYVYSSFRGDNYVRKLESGATAGTINIDTGWQKVCTTKVVDKAITGISSSHNDITIGNVSCYSVVNGICYVTIWDFHGLATGYGKVFVNDMPKSKQFAGTPIIGANNGGGNIGFVYIDGMTLYAHVYTDNVTGYCSFSYPVAES